jgi:hypothetical protein
VCRPDGATAAGGDTSEGVLPANAEVPALCIELVGNRFLRRMVRILTVRGAYYSIRWHILIDVEVASNNDLYQCIHGAGGLLVFPVLLAW